MINFNIFNIFDIFEHQDILGGGGIADICIVVMGTSGDWRGHITGSGSEITPNATYSGLPIFEYKWNIVTGEFIISFGDTGDTEVENVLQLSIKHPNRPDRNSAYWDETETAYTFVDLDLAQWVGSDLTRSCFLVEPQFIDIVDIDFNETQTGTGE